MKIPLDIKKYKKLNLNIPFIVYLSFYKDFPNLQYTVEFICRDCNLLSTIRWNRLTARKNKTLPLCKKCNHFENSPNCRNTPIELRNLGSKENPVPFSLFLKHNNYSNGSKKWIKINCQECKQDKLIQWRKIKNRNPEYGQNLPVCSDCIMGFTTSNKKWRKKNSEAQLIAQNRPEVIEKHRISQHEKMKNDKEYRDKKLSSRRRTLSGSYNNIKFDSSYELSFIVYYENCIERCKFFIPYVFKGIKKLYYPDFVLNLPEGNVLVEIKDYHKEIVDVKASYAKDFIKNKGFIDYKIYYYDDLKQLPNFVFYNNNEKLLSLDQEKLVINCYPKSFGNIK